MARLLFFNFGLLLWLSSAMAQSAISFADVTAQSSLALERITTSEKRYLPETMGGGVAWMDYDNDGWLDAFLTNAPTVESFKAKRVPACRLFRNNHDGTFTDVSEKAGVALRAWAMGASVADYNHDGWADLYVTCLGANVLYQNKGDGTFADVTKAAGVGDARWSASSGWGDYDGDGDVDLFVVNYVAFDLNELPEFGRGRYCLFRSLEVLCGPRGMKGAGDTLYRNNGDGTFTDVSTLAGVSDERGAFGLGCAWGDFDNDGDQDLYVTNDTQANYLYLNQGNGTFKEAGLLSGAALDGNGKARAGMGIAVGDYDRDGKLDIGVTNFSDEAYALFHNDGAGAFTDKAVAAGMAKPTLPYLGWGLFFGDFDNDGWLDLFGANGHVYPQVERVDIGTKYRQRCLLLRNLGNGSFAEVDAGEAVRTPRAHRGAALGDYDNDGDLDLLLMDLDAQPILLENRSPQKNWLRVKAPIGTRITLAAGKLQWVDEVRGSGSYQSASESIAHFGVGDVPTIDRIVARFTNGKTKTLTTTKVNQTITIKG